MKIAILYILLKKIISFTGRFLDKYVKRLVKEKKENSMYENYKGEKENHLNFYRPYKSGFRISSPYGKRGKGFHRGCDYVGKKKDLFAIGWSKVIRKGYQEGGAGLYLVLQSLWYTKNYIEIKYFHLQKAYLTIDDEVLGGDPLGVEGNTGHSTGSHLHLEIWIDGKHIDPEDESIVNWIKHS